MFNNEMFNNEMVRKVLEEFRMKCMGLNEFETMKLFLTYKGAVDIPQMVWNELEKLNVSNKSISCRTSESIHLREQGNKLFKDSPEQYALDASRFYTKAVFVAPLGSEALALAHANRAIALQKFGYFQQAYDDCECALEQGYPINLRQKIIARQAACAAKLGDAALLEKHLNALNSLPLNKNYETQVEQLQQSLEELHLNQNNSEKNEENIKEFRGPLKIVKTKSKGRCLVAEKPIKKDELIFTERAFSFVQVSERHVCQSCAATQLIPFPCYSCYGKVVYCSLKCRVAHQAIHAYECVAYQKNLLQSPFGDLALRIMLDGIQEIISFLRKKRTSKEIWNELTCESSTLQQSNLKYVQSLRMMTHLEKKPLSNVLMPTHAFILTWYLQNQTNFFNLFKSTKASLKDWKLVIASLLLRHMGQLLTNGNTLVVLAIKIRDPYDSTLLVNKLWQSPFHVRRGFLHMFCACEAVISANFPYFSLCNHACSPSMIMKRNGPYLSAYAANNIEAGNEILNSYVMGTHTLRRSQRQRFLMETFNFKCECGKCTKENPDEDYENYRRFRCENLMCRQIFTSDISLSEILNSSRHSGLSCTKCHANQLGLIQSVFFLHLLRNTESKENMKNLLHTFNGLNKWLLDPHRIKFELSIELVKDYFALCNADSSTQFSDYIVSKMIEILKYHLQCVIEQFHIKTIDYVGPMTYLWDFIALGKYKCGADEMQKMVEAIEFLPDETRKLFINYYNDYIVGNIML